MLRRMLDCARITAEFGLGQLLGVAPLAGGHPDVRRLAIALNARRIVSVMVPCAASRAKMRSATGCEGGAAKAARNRPALSRRTLADCQVLPPLKDTCTSALLIRDGVAS